ncbi:unnamed protein product [Schistosoma curassoni]|uniref:BRX domain-containing protein n=1 Tax=Schistosoma curassoni TaxID=6186 RepID=A0A183L834_9TREM|nr:unnamed protein product [Schistosoma curassoni]
MNYLDDAHVLDKNSYKNEENMSDASNDNQEPNAVLMDDDYHSDPLSTNEILNKFEEAVSEESNFGDLISSVVDPHHLITFSGFSVQCDKYVLNKVKLIVTWEYEDRILFWRRRITPENLKSEYQLRIFKKRGGVMSR